MENYSLQNNPEEKTRVLVLEQQRVTQQLLTEAISDEQEMKLIGMFDSARQGIDYLKHTKSDILITDIQLNDGSAVPAITYCREHHPNCATLVWTESSRETDFNECIEAGAIGYVLKGDGLLQLVRAIKEVRQGGAPISALLVRRFLLKPHRNKNVGPSRQNRYSNIKLTDQEKRVLNLVAQGLTYFQIADALSISIFTVQNYIKRLYRKLAVNSRAKAVLEAERCGLIDLSESDVETTLG